LTELIDAEFPHLLYLLPFYFLELNSPGVRNKMLLKLDIFITFKKLNSFSDKTFTCHKKNVLALVLFSTVFGIDAQDIKKKTELFPKESEDTAWVNKVNRLSWS
jgi:hypothetical protein